MQNAFKFSPNGGQIKVELKQANREGRYSFYRNSVKPKLLISVTDSGPGVKPED